MKTAHNVVANVGGRLWTLLMNFAFIPLYVRFMGVEAYGLVGFFATMLAIFSILDMGLSLAVNRELVRLDAAGDIARSRNLTRTLELVYWVVGGIIALMIYLGADFVTHRWLEVSQLPVETATTAVQLMALVALLRWPSALYMGVLMGLREHVALNLIMAGVATLAGAGAVLILWQVSPSVTAFFAWQIFAAAIQVALLIFVTWRKLRLRGHRAAFELSALRAIYRFSAGIFIVTILSVILMQLDKLVLSATLSLTDFGYYTLAFTIGNVLATVGLAIHGALFPSLSHVVALGDEREITAFYHKCCQLMAAAIVPAGAVLALFAPELLQLYLHNAGTAARITLLVTIFAIANTIFAIMMMPYALQLAFGWTRLSIYKNLIAIAIYIPLLFVMVHFFGAIGAALAWLILMAGYLLFEITIMHRRLLAGERGRWYLQDVMLPILLGAGIVGATRLATGGTTPLVAVALATVAGGIATLAIVWASAPLRGFALQFLRNSRWRDASRQKML
ncbi:oligosaccharide flippase family protein [Sphingomonas sp. M1-B02]|uniref:oligosaccharide flippase family protein n=1 Tax=Sphingomonas sp. M1-B02 TaxID=3114300 RepID=UPI00223F78DA|nr:oligosaccharide flippase family protein [Sphingomonas sp. S6-11]UZK65062.1 oligosaccharide flippase family protein [Sphingomonas sp. S6-11]